MRVTFYDASPSLHPFSTHPSYRQQRRIRIRVAFSLLLTHESYATYLDHGDVHTPVPVPDLDWSAGGSLQPPPPAPPPQPKAMERAKEITKERQRKSPPPTPCPSFDEAMEEGAGKNCNRSSASAKRTNI